MHRLSPDLQPVWEVLHRRISEGRPVHRIKVGPLTDAQRTAVADLLGDVRLPGEYWSIGLSRLDDVLFDRIGCDGRTVVEQLLGPVGNRAAERSAAAAERSALWEWLAGHDVIRAQPVLGAWAAAMRRAGLVGGSVERTRQELDCALRVLRAIPATGSPLPVFAESTVGDPHALDEGNRLQTMIVRALTILYDRELPTGAAELRQLWACAGISDDELSSTVLLAGVPVHGATGPVPEILRTCARTGTAAVLTLQQLRRTPRWPAAAERVFVVENPSILAMALQRFGDRCPPMICISGWPSSAAVELLRQAADAGAGLWYHGDFDGDGLRIAANLVARLGARPWRMSSADYLAAFVPEGPPVGRVEPVPWDPELAGHMVRLGRAVPEERVADTLFSDIAP
ncbi:TIGR02679 family protein [Nocardia sp. NBC_00416]|uniref:TIGR02679 family protein n=1 Tax=Nocardia sp. NBC_00416 TaxID=2975991 RepID=UPI002E24160D